MLQALFSVSLGSVDSVSFGDRSLRHQDEKQAFRVGSAIDYFLQAVKGVARARFFNIIDADRKFLGKSHRPWQCGILCSLKSFHIPSGSSFSYTSLFPLAIRLIFTIVLPPTADKTLVFPLASLWQVLAGVSMPSPSPSIRPIAAGGIHRRWNSSWLRCNSAWCAETCPRYT